jgi:hypothetical protein
MSEVVPAAKGTIMVTVREGHVWAEAASALNTPDMTAAAATAIKRAAPIRFLDIQFLPPRIMKFVLKCFSG